MEYTTKEYLNAAIAAARDRAAISGQPIVVGEITKVRPIDQDWFTLHSREQKSIGVPILEVTILRVVLARSDRGSALLIELAEMPMWPDQIGPRKG